jgi:hypothetical protein
MRAIVREFGQFIADRPFYFTRTAAARGVFRWSVLLPATRFCSLEAFRGRRFGR